MGASNKEIIEIIKQKLSHNDIYFASVSRKASINCVNHSNNDVTYDSIVQNPIFVYNDQIYHGHDTLQDIGFGASECSYVVILSCTKQNEQSLDAATPTSPLSRISASFSNFSNDAKDEKYHELRQCVENICMGMSTDAIYSKQELIEFIHVFIQRKFKKSLPKTKRSQSLNDLSIRQHKKTQSKFKKLFQRKIQTKKNEMNESENEYALPIEREQPHILSISRRTRSRDNDDTVNEFKIYRR